MNLYTTLIQAISPITGELTLYAGPNIPGISFNDAREFCERNGLGYCKVDGLLEAEISGDQIIDYMNFKMN
jgi:hypothetical protein